MVKMKESPCIRCKRVAEPEKCDNKDCALWRHWFTERWGQMRADFERIMAQQEKESWPSRRKNHELENRGNGKTAFL